MTAGSGKKGSRKRKFICLWLLLFLFVTSQYIGWKLAEEGNIRWNLGGTLLLLAAGLLVSAAAGLGILALEGLVMRQSLGREKKALAGIRELPGPSRCFGLALASMLLCWLPGYLAYYPGICAYDITIQMGQVVSGSYGTHHPLAHTLLVGLFAKLGNGLGDVNTGIALYTAFQLLCLALTFGAGIAWLRSLRVGTVWIALTWIWCCLFPFHIYMSVTVTKDVFFTMFFLLQMICFCQLIHQGENRLGWGRWDVGYLLSALGMVLFRNNGRYALLAVAFFLAVGCIRRHGHRRLALRLLTGTLAGILAGSLGLSLLARGTGAQQGDKREMLSIPIQQLARTMIYHGGAGVLPEDDATMEERDRQLIDDFLLDQAYREYRPDIADPVKRHTYTYVVRYRTREFLDTYLRLLARYPGDYVNAAFAVNMGYYYIGDESHAHINENGLERGLGYIQTRWVEHELADFGIYKDSKWEGLHEAMERYADENMYLRAPVLRMIMVPGVYLWIWLSLAAFLWIRKKYMLILPVSLIAGYYVTLVLGPTVQLRYLYPVMTAVPFVLLFVKAECAGRADAELKLHNARIYRTALVKRIWLALCSQVTRQF